MISVVSGEHIVHPKDHFIVLKMLKMENMEYNKKRSVKELFAR